MLPIIARWDLPLLGTIEIQTYGLAAVLALAAGWVLARHYLLALGIDPVHLYWAPVFFVPAIAVGAKVLPLIQNPFFRAQVVEAAQTPRGLLAVALALAMPGGSLLSAAIFALGPALLYTRIYRLPVLECIDAVSPGVALAIPIMRLGCLGAGCCYGTPTGLPWGVTYTNPVTVANTGAPLGIAVHPSQLYEAALVLGLCAMLVRLYPRWRGGGDVALALAGGYSAIRFFVEFVRGDSQAGPHIGPLTVTQVVVLVLLVGTIVLLRRRRSPGAVSSRDRPKSPQVTTGRMTSFTSKLPPLG